MLKIGRYAIAWGRTFWFQTLGPVRIWHFLWFWFIKFARAHDVDRKQRYPLGTLLEQEGRRFRYFKASDDVKKGAYVAESHNEKVVKPKRGENVKIHLTEQSAEILLSEEEVQTLVKGKEVIGSPSTTFLSPFGRRIVIVRQARLEEIRASHTM